MKAGQKPDKSGQKANKNNNNGRAIEEMPRAGTGPERGTSSLRREP
jgi:hypothetical protein